MSARDMALFGELYRNMGIWKGAGTVPETWIQESTTIYPVSNSGQYDPYGYLWRIIPEE
jgi:CubicO group peptidase (beta-lactamase class C family)